MAEHSASGVHRSRLARELIQSAIGAESAAEVGRRFFAALQPYGARALWARAYPSAAPNQEYSYSRISPPRWEQVYADGRFAEANFINRHGRRAAGPFSWLSVARRTSREVELEQVLADLGYPDGIAAPIQEDGYFGMTSIAFERLGQLTSEERSAIGLAANVLHQRMRALTAPSLVQMRPLSPRERDCLALVADGKSDWEIGEILGVAETTVLTHMQSARRKLGARSRAQAVAVGLLSGML
ncbi:MAG TPA: LuxR C-terminal-related transcriptional regulator [Caulobacteraceae bacterium]|jgi:LuxR family quorum sensing-dependent transcriptional regulator